ncbi:MULTISPECIES: SPOR domain-containing protein [Burkholderiaceae]|uniref:SPOR domain-containing protein n=1 Tax=Burkholderiaceae TaxID=119060 RepID=UPI00095C5A64|nr:MULTISPECIES: SPOR domain-containing protein [Burkholderiaceae]MCF2135033.1 SPOR domain-containing protein [Mycetohabitans sp. B3]MCG1040350.1 SPOR domain-containing protein [Mycetohabitans sp. B7]SIT74174.1 cell division protein FtsN [Burkholderia sp. b14]
MAKARRSSSPNSKQRGGTFLGIVLGLIVGLAIAIVVALYIRGAPTPFVSKGNAPAATSDTAGSGATFDPNRVLAGKSPGQPVPPSGTQPPPNTAPGQSSQQSQSTDVLEEPQIIEVPSTASATPAQPKPGAPWSPSATLAPRPAPPGASAPTPASAKLGAGTPAAPQKPGASEANTGYFLQVGAYRTEQDAEQQRARLALQGFESKVTQRDAGGVVYYRVRIGPFSRFEDMNSARQRLSDAGIDTVVIRFTKP